MSEWIRTSEDLPEPGVPVIAAYRNELGKWRRVLASYIAERMLEADEDKWWPNIAAYRNELGKWRRVRTSYIAERMLEADEDKWWPNIEALYYEENDGPWCPAGWYEECECHEISRQVDGEVELWTPLPPLPNDADEEN